MAEPFFDFSIFPTLTTPRLVLREIVPGDAPGIFAIRGDYEVTRYNIGAAYLDLTQAGELIAGMTRQYHEHKELRWGITLKPEVGGDGTVIGMCGFNYWHRTDRRGSIGFDLARAYWRRGIMREALEAILDFGFTHMSLNRIEADASTENTVSIALLERLGFRREGTQREQYFEEGAFHDLALFALLRREWSQT
jgi:[ribosomal protein S5]-alanine N-acetyltransferase